MSRKPINIDCDIERGLKIVRDFSQEHSAQHPDIDFFIYGHLHIAINEILPTGKRMAVLGEWISHSTFATFDGSILSLQEFEKV